MTMQTHEQDRTRTHGKRLGILTLAIALGAVALNWAGNRAFEAGLAAGPVRYVDGLALLCAVAAMAAVWSLTRTLVAPGAD